MPDEKFTFEQAKIRLEEIAAEVRKKDTSLEKSLDLLEEGVRLANICTELVDHTDVSATVSVPGEPAQESDAVAESEPEVASIDTPGDEPEVAEASEPADEADEGEGFDDADDAVVEAADAEADE